MTKNTPEQTGSFTILERALQTYEQWHKKTGFSFTALFDTNSFTHIFELAGYDTSELSDFGCFFVPVQREPLVAALEQVLSENEDQDTEFSAIFLAGVLGAVELVPAIRASIRRNMEFTVAPVMAVRSMYILGVSASEIVSFLHELGDHSWKNTAFPILVSKELETPGPEAAQRAADFLREFLPENSNKDSEIFGVIYRYAAEIQRRGVDLSDLSECILQKHARKDPNLMERVRWVFTVASIDLIQAILSDKELHAITTELFCQAIEDRHKRELIRSVVLEMQPQLIKKNELVPALLPLLHLYGIDVSSYADSTNWEHRFGSIISEVFWDDSPRSTGEYLALMTKENDLEVRSALYMNYLLRCGQFSEASIADFDAFYRAGFDYLPRLTRAIVIGRDLEDRFPTVELDSFIQDYRSREELRQRFGDHGSLFLSLLVLEQETWYSSFYDNLLKGRPRALNILLHALDSTDERVDACLQELFLNCVNSNEAYALLMMAEGRGIQFVSFAARIKAKVLRSNPNKKKLEKDEFEIVFPTLLDTSVDWTLIVPLIRSCSTMLQQRPEWLMALIRAWAGKKTVLKELVGLVTPVEGDGLSSVLASARDGAFHKYLPLAIYHLAAMDEIVSSVAQPDSSSLWDSHLLSMLTRETDSYSLENVENVFAILSEKMSLGEQAAHFASELLGMAIHEQQATARHISRHPHPIFAPLLKHLRDSNSKEVRITVQAAADRLVATTAAGLPIASLVRESMDKAVLHARSRISDPEMHRQHLERTCIVSLVDIESPIPRDTAMDALMPVSMINNLILYMQVDYADEKQAVMVARVGAQETTETLSWLMEQSGVAHFVVQ